MTDTADRAARGEILMKPWQIGVVVDDLGSAMEDIGEAMGLTWMSTQREIDVIHEG